MHVYNIDFMFSYSISCPVEAAGMAAACRAESDRDHFRYLLWSESDARPRESQVPFRTSFAQPDHVAAGELPLPPSVLRTTDSS